MDLENGGNQQRVNSNKPPVRIKKDKGLADIYSDTYDYQDQNGVQHQRMIGAKSPETIQQLRNSYEFDFSNKRHL